MKHQNFFFFFPCDLFLSSLHTTMLLEQKMVLKDKKFTWSSVGYMQILHTNKNQTIYTKHVHLKDFFFMTRHLKIDM